MFLLVLYVETWWFLYAYGIISVSSCKGTEKTTDLVFVWWHVHYMKSISWTTWIIFVTFYPFLDYIWIFWD